MSHNIRDFGAVGDGIHLDTEAIQRAIDAGGTVYFPPGTYLSGTIYLHSHGGLDLDAGAVLLGSSDPADYNKPESVKFCHCLFHADPNVVFCRIFRRFCSDFRRVFRQFSDSPTCVVDFTKKCCN